MKRLLFVDLTEGHDPKRLYEKPTGGTLTSLTKIPEYLAKQGYEVYVASTYGKSEIYNGVHYIVKGETVPKWDVTIFNRNVLPNDFVTYCKQQGSKIIWWLHDIVDTRYLPDATFKLVDHIVALSNYCKETYSDFYDIKKEIISVISNGVDNEIFTPGDYEKRNPHLFITASALIKGYAPLQVTYDSLKAYDPDLDFRIYSSQKLHGFENTNSQQQFLDNMKKVGAHIYHPTSPKVLASIMQKAWGLLMPNSYPEICSNLLLQARACGLPVVTSQIGANPEFIEDGQQGLVTFKYYPHDIHSWIVEFAKAACQLQQDEELHKVLSLEAPKGVPTWDSIGEKWNELIQTLLK